MGASAWIYCWYICWALAPNSDGTIFLYSSQATQKSTFSSLNSDLRKLVNTWRPAVGKTKRTHGKVIPGETVENMMTFLVEFHLHFHKTQWNQETFSRKSEMNLDLCISGWWENTASMLTLLLIFFFSNTDSWKIWSKQLRIWLHRVVTLPGNKFKQFQIDRPVNKRNYNAKLNCKSWMMRVKRKLWRHQRLGDQVMNTRTQTSAASLRANASNSVPHFS